MAKKKDPHWMEKAFGKHPGKFSAKARKAGKTTAAYAKEEASAPGVLGREARLAEVGMREGKKAHRRAAHRPSAKIRRAFEAGR